MFRRARPGNELFLQGREGRSKEKHHAQAQMEISVLAPRLCVMLSVDDSG
jgi:hypothetical protein